MVGGHGGTFVVKEDNTPLIITGGASGANYQIDVIWGTNTKRHNGRDILIGFTNGVAYSTDFNGSDYLNNGNGGNSDQGSSQGQSGAGFNGDALVSV